MEKGRGMSADGGKELAECEVRMIKKRSNRFHGVTWTDAYPSIICQL